VSHSGNHHEDSNYNTTTALADATVASGTARLHHRTLDVDPAIEADVLDAAAIAYYDAGDFQAAREAFQLACEKGSLIARYNIAMLCMAGVGGPKDPEKALAHLRVAASEGLRSAMTMLGKILCDGDGVLPAPEEAYRWFSLAAQHGDTNAQMQAGRMLYYGSGVAVDLTEAFRLFSLAAGTGHPEAIFNIADMLEHGTGVVQDTAKAYQLYHQAHALHFVEATHRLGLAFYNGIGVPQDRDIARTYWREAADKDCIKSRFCLACALIQSDSDAEEIIHLLVLAARSGHGESVTTLVRFLTAECTDPQNAFKTLQRIAPTLRTLKLNPASCFLLATLYFEHGTAQSDHDEGVFWATIAATDGHAEAQLLLGSLYLNGSGVLRNFETAYSLFSQSATGGSEAAALLSLVMTYEGLGTPKNTPEALRQWAKLSHKIAPEAKRQFESILCSSFDTELPDSPIVAVLTDPQLTRCWPVEINPGDTSMNVGASTDLNAEESGAVNALQALAMKGHVPAIFVLGQLCQTGIGVPENFSLAIECFAKAASAGYNPARMLLRKLQEAN